MKIVYVTFTAMITQHTHPYGSTAEALTSEHGLKKGGKYVVDGWHGDRVIILIDGQKRWFKASNFQ